MTTAIAPSACVRYSDPQTMSSGTLPSNLLHAMDTWPSPRAQMFRAESGWQEISTAEFLRRIAGLSQALYELGVKSGDRVGLFASNRPEWHTADFAISGCGGITVPIYFNESADRMTYILNHAEAKVLFIAGAAQLAKLLEIRPALQHLEHVIVADGGESIPADCLRYETLIASASAAEVAAYRLRASQVLPNQLASIIYTSGTTGEPKGVMLTHHNFCSNANDVGCDFNLDSNGDLALSFLPLAHVYGR
ncbi:MAG TPA: AMP-binding protein, partial [Candidatus Acidoferrum sp.]|nr:AMP-binding protein [Candidatus Acidoferrum sp.]